MRAMSWKLRDQAKSQNSPPLQGRGRGWGLSAERIEQLGSHAKDNRREPTEPEKRLWGALSRSQLGGHKFRRQAIIGQFIVDFACPQKGLVVEVDGHTHADPARDAWRDAKLAELGFSVFRVSNTDVMQNLEGVCDALLTLLTEMPSRFERPHPNSSPEGEGLKEAQKLLGMGLEGSVG
jgi:very-short-patch-repair endonuclease